MFNCAVCNLKSCTKRDLGHLPKICPTRESDIQKEAMRLYSEEEDRLIAYNAALVEKEGAGKVPRIQETINFIKKCNFKKIGIIFCMTLGKEANMVEKLLEENDLDVVGVMCKNGGFLKSDLGVVEKPTGEITKKDIMCNPIGQALYLNQQKTDFNIMLGLCVGHDTLAIKHLESPVTILAVKDRVYNHNPLAALNCDK